VVEAKEFQIRILKKISGQPMIYWPLMELKKIFSSENILISTNSELIKERIEAKGLTVPFLRPAALSDDYTGTTAVVEHALDWYEANVKKVDFVLTVYPTAVLLNENDILEPIGALDDDHECDSVMSATNFSFPIQRAVFENDLGYAEMFYPEHYSTRSQDSIEAKHDAGQFYLSKAIL